MLARETLFFILPLLISGSLHHFLVIKNNSFRILAKPVDFGIKFGNRRLFGDSKTFRGFLVVIFLIGFFMWAINAFFCIRLNLNPFVSGALLGLGYSLGELPNSFLKRRLGVKESRSAPGFLGAVLYIIDQTDSIIGSLIFLPLVYSPSLTLVVTLFVCGSVAHAFVDICLYLFGYKKALLSK